LRRRRWHHDKLQQIVGPTNILRNQRAVYLCLVAAIGQSKTYAKGGEFIFSIVADLTEQERSRTTEVNLAKIIEESLNEICIVRSNSGQLIYANRAARRDYLLQQGCALAQGYLFAKPVPAAAFGTLPGDARAH
jgi:hypothetical protein